jgi:BASS family bile acid:Na+ symporter
VAENQPDALVNMPFVNSLTAALAFLGRHGTLAVALSIFIGLFLPAWSATFKPILTETIVALLTLAFLRVQPSALTALVRRPTVVVVAAVWVMLVLPPAVAALFALLHVKAASSDLYFILVLQSCAPGLMSSPALAALMGLDVALTVAGLALSMIVAPFSASLFTHIFLGTSLITPVGLGVKLALMIGGTAVAAALIRWLAGNARVDGARQAIDGLSVIGLFVFAVAAMDGVVAHALANPALVIGLTALSFALSLGAILVTTLLFLPAGRHRAFAIGLLAGNRNIGLMMAATGFAVPDLVWLYFAVAQFPIYLLPMLLKPVARRLEEADRAALSV